MKRALILISDYNKLDINKKILIREYISKFVGMDVFNIRIDDKTKNYMNVYGKLHLPQPSIRLINKNQIEVKTS